jgi:hypothetical protein
MKNFFKNPGNNAREEAKKIAKRVVHEPAEILSDIPGQVTPLPEKTEPEEPVMQQVMTGGGNVKDVSLQEEQDIRSQTKSRLAQIEGELKQLRTQREQKGQEWVQDQEALLGHKEGVSQEVPAPLEIPHSVPKGPRFGVVKKGGTMEQGRTRKG